MKSFSIFISSPSDVRLEREEARRVIEQLSKEFAGRAEVGSYFWESQPLEAAKAPQASIREANSCDIVVGIVWKRMGTPLRGEKYRRADGTFYESGTAYELETSLAANRGSGTPRVLLYRNGRAVELRAEPPEARKEDAEQYDALTAFLARNTRDADGAWKGAYKTYASVELFKQSLDEDLTRLIEAELGSSHDAPRDPAWQESPFRGLEIFDLQHEAIFFGRTAAINEILERLQRQAAAAHPFVLVLGMSGCGKSSLIRAGVLPRLFRARAVSGIEVWRHAILKPREGGGEPVEALAKALLAPTALPWLDGGEVNATRLRENLDETVGALRQSLRQAGERERDQQRETIRTYIDRLERDNRTAEAEEVRAKLDDLPTPKAGLVLVIDQLEELFDDQTTAEQRVAFMTVVDRLVRKGVAHVLATLRSDFYSRCNDLPGLEQLKAGDGQLDLSWPSKADIGQMIRQPARLAALQFETDAKSGQTLDDRLADDAAKFPENLPLLEFVLDALYQSRTDKRLLTHEAYDKLGGLEGAIAKKANDVWTSLGAPEQTANDVFSSLVQISSDDGGRVRRKYAPAAALRQDPKRREFVDAFVAARLFVSAGDAGISTVSLAHETLIEHFPPLKEWVNTNRERLRVRARLAAQAALWEEKEHAADLLFRGSQLGEVLKARDAWIDLTTVEKEFIDASKSKRSRNRFGAAGVAFLLVALIGGTAYGVWRNYDAKKTAQAQALVRDADAAREERPDEAVAKAQDATRMRPEIGAEALRRALASRELATPVTDADSVRAVAFARHRPIVAVGTWKGAFVRDLATSNEAPALDPDDNVESVSFGPDDAIVMTAGAKGVRLWREANKPVNVPTNKLPINSAAFSPDGREIAFIDDRQLRVWTSTDTWKGESLHEVPGGNRDDVERFAFSPDGKPATTRSHVNDVAVSPDGEIVVEGLDNGSARLWRKDDWGSSQGNVVAILKGHEDRVVDVDYSPSGRFIATASADGSAIVWEASTSAQVARFHAPKRSAIRGVAFSGDGGLLATGGDDGNVRVWRPGGDTYPLPHDGPVNAAQFSPDGTFVITASDDGKARIWFAASGELVAMLQPPAASDPVPLKDVAIDPAGRWVAAGAEGGGVNLWDARTCAHLTEIAAHKGDVTSVSYLRDGTLMTAGADGVVRFWAADTWKPVDPELPQDEPVTAAAASPVDDAVIATAGAKGTLRVWNRKASHDPRTLGSVKGRLNDIDFSGDGKHLLTAGPDATARIWDLATGAVQTLEPAGPGQPLRTARFRPGSSPQVLTADTVGRVRLWDLATARVVAELPPHRGPVMRAAFRRDGLAVVTAGSEGTARVDPWFAFVDVDELLQRSQLKPDLPHPRPPDVFACPPAAKNAVASVAPQAQ